jgi:hypothetical protein
VEEQASLLTAEGELIEVSGRERHIHCAVSV